MPLAGRAARDVGLLDAIEERSRLVRGAVVAVDEAVRARVVAAVVDARQLEALGDGLARDVTSVERHPVAAELGLRVGDALADTVQVEGADDPVVVIRGQVDHEAVSVLERVHVMKREERLGLRA